jgi:hypothetical protein
MASAGKQVERPRPSRLRTACWWVGGAVLLAAVVIVGARIRERPSQADVLDASVLNGRWVRADGGYLLELTDFRPEGGLTATYRNPKPINVSRAQWREQDGALHVYVELRDKGYPGSTYTLAYQAAPDRLAGTYYQAVLKQTFAVEFRRVEQSDAVR